MKKGIGKNIRRATHWLLVLLLTFQVFALPPQALMAVGDDIAPTIDSFVISADEGKSAAWIAAENAYYTNDTSPIISAAYSDNAGGSGINAESAAVRVDGAGIGFLERDAVHILANPTLIAGTYAIKISVRDVDGNPAEETKTLIIDTLAPAAPVLTLPLDSSTNNDATPTVAGNTDPNVAVKVYDGVDLVATGSADAYGSFSLETAPLAEGSHLLTAAATDYAGNVSAPSNEINYSVDLTPPAVPTVTPLADTNNPRPTFAWNDESASGAVSYHLRIDDDNAFSSPFIDTVAAGISLTPDADLPSTIYYWQVSSLDQYGNESDFSATDSFEIDSTLPFVASITLSDPSPTRAGDLTITVDFSEVMDMSVLPAVTFGAATPFDQHSTDTSWSDADTLAATVNIPDDGTLDGLQTLKIAVGQDAAGNVMNDDMTTQFAIDTLKPVISLNGESIITVEAGTAYDELGATWTDANDGSGDANISGTVDVYAVGDHTISYNYTDSAGNAAETVSRTVQVRDTLAPAFSNLAPAEDSITPDVFAPISGTLTDSGTGIDWSTFELNINGIPVSNSDIDFSGGDFEYLPAVAYDDGAYFVSISAADQAGNANSQSWIFSVATGPTITGVAAAGGNIVGGYLNSTNTALIANGTVPADSGIQTVYLYVAGSGTPITSTLVLSGLTDFAISVSGDALADLTATDGEKVLRAKRVGSTGNHSDYSETVSIQVDKTLPAAPDAGLIIVSENQPGTADEIAGLAGALDPAGVSVHLYDESDVEIASVLPNADLGFDPVAIGDNQHATVKVAVRDVAGNESAGTTVANDITAPPAPIITSPLDNTFANNPDLTITGTGETESAIAIYADVILLVSGNADSDGNFFLSTTLPADGLYSITAYATDSAGNVSASSAAINYTLDRAAPTASAVSPNGVTNDNGAPISVTWTDAGVGFDSDPTRSLVFGPLVRATAWNDTTGTMTYTPADTSDDDTYSVTASIVDRAGNVGSTVFEFTIDTAPPIITLVGESDVYIEIGDTYIDAGATAQDEREGDISGHIIATGDVDTTVAGDYIITYNVSDEAGNVAVPVVRNITVADTLAPTVDAGEDVVTNAEISRTGLADGTGTAISGYAWSEPTGHIIFGTADAATTTLSADVEGTYTITLTVTDGGGNTAFDTFELTWDTTAPVITLIGPADLDTEVHTSYDDAGATALDNYDGDITVSIITDNPVNISVLGDYIVRYNVTDTAGNSAIEVTRTVHVIDSTAPIITLIGGDHISTEVYIPYIDPGATALDNYDGDITGSIVPTGTVDADTIGDYLLYYNVTDAAGNAAAEVTRTVHVVDTTAPITTLEVAPVDPDGNNGWYQTNPTVTLSAIDNHDGAPITYYRLNGGSETVYTTPVTAFDQGVTNFEYWSTDTAGNVETVQSTPFKFDDDPPNQISGGGVKEDMNSDALDDDVTNDKAVAIIWNTSSDSTSGVDHYELRARVGSVSGSEIISNYDIGLGTSYTLTPEQADLLADGTEYFFAVRVVDAAGNWSNYRNSDGITIDQIAPTITLVGNAEETVEVHTSYDDAGATATDNYDGDITGSIITANPVNIDVVGDYIVRYNVVDTAGNAAAEVTRTVHVVDATAPVITLIPPAEMDVELHTLYEDAGATALDNYDGDITILINVDNPIDIHTVGDYIVRYNVADAAGNAAAEVTRLVHVIDTTAPVVTVNSLITNDTTPTLTGTIDDSAATIQISVNGHTYAAIVSSNTWSAAVTDELAEGIYEVAASATDTAGNVGSDDSLNELEIDLTAPVLTEVIPVASPTADNTPNYTFNSSEAGTITYLNCSSAATMVIAGDNTIELDPFADGDHADCQISITDQAGNMATLAVSAFRIDTTGPTAAFSLMITGDATPTISGTVTDVGSAVATVNVTANGRTYAADLAGDTWTVTLTEPLTGGTYDIVVETFDILGNRSEETFTGSLIIDLSAPEVVSVTPTGTISDRRPTISATLRDDASGIASVTMRINGIAVGTYDPATETVSFTPARDLAARTYAVSIDAHDNNGNVMTRYTFTFTIE
ncbi:MAG: immunoglobulin-like domain-containing protein [Patescibacteria group bacterium]